ncbi:MAG: amidase [Candidatus Lokiarchaeota archaeon]
MNDNEICFMSAVEMKEKIRTRELSCQKITETIINRIEKINPEINAYCTPTFEIAREKAIEADKAIRKEENLGLLHGIPTSIKDLMQTEGIRTTFGFKPYENNIPEKNEVAVQRLYDEGIVMLGKTNTPAFGHMAVTDNMVFGKTYNPWNRKRTAGGSSGGAGAAVASGMGPLALGSDGGGSIRIPAAFNGIFGLKPTFGRIPRDLHGHIGWITLDHYGSLTRNVEDAALMLDALAGPDSIDRFCIPKPKMSYLDSLNENPSKLKIGYSLKLGFVKALDPELKEMVIKAAKKFEEADLEVEEAKLRIKKPELAFNTLVTSGFAYDLNSFMNDEEKIDESLLKMIKAGSTYSATDVKRAEYQREKIYASIAEYFNKYDLLITPTTAVPPFDLGIMYPPKIAGKAVSPVAWMSFTYPFNLTGHPAASIPCGFTSDKTPVGMQIIGRMFDETSVLQASKLFQDIQPWQDKKPEFDL